MRPLAQSDGHDAPGLLDEHIPSVAAVVDEIVVGTPWGRSRRRCRWKQGRRRMARRPADFWLLRRVLDRQRRRSLKYPIAHPNRATIFIRTTSQPLAPQPDCRPPLHAILSHLLAHFFCGNQIPIAPAALPRIPQRGFLPWRFSYAGPTPRRTLNGGPASENLHTKRTHAPRQFATVQLLDHSIGRCRTAMAVR
jgi:hypothetical protein